MLNRFSQRSLHQHTKLCILGCSTIVVTKSAMHTLHEEWRGREPIKCKCWYWRERMFHNHGNLQQLESNNQYFMSFHLLQTSRRHIRKRLIWFSSISARSCNSASLGPFSTFGALGSSGRTSFCLFLLTTFLFGAEIAASTSWEKNLDLASELGSFTS